MKITSVERLSAPLRHLMAVPVVALLALAVGVPSTAVEGPDDSIIEACYAYPFSPDQRLPFDVSQEEWCHPLFKDIEATTEPGGVVTISWEPASRHVSWYCGPGYGKQDCPINEYRVEASNYGTAVRCSVGPGGRTCTLRGLSVLYTQPVTLSAYLANGNWFRVHLVVEPCCKPPSSPKGVTATAVQDGIDVTWAAPDWWGGAPELTYTVTTEPPSTTCSSTGLACRLEGLAYGEPYTVSVVASNVSGPGKSASASAPVTIEVATPSAPRDVVASGSQSGRILVRWTAPEVTGGQPVSGYVVTASPGSKTCKAPSSRSSCTFSDLTSGTTYSFTVQAVNALGRGDSSAPASITVKRLQQQPPRNVTAEGKVGAITVSWDPPQDRSRKNPIRFVVETQSGTASCATTQTACTLTGLAPGKTYAINVVARSARGTSTRAVTSASVPVPQVEPPKPPLQIG